MKKKNNLCFIFKFGSNDFWLYKIRRSRQRRAKQR